MLSIQFKWSITKLLCTLQNFDHFENGHQQENYSRYWIIISFELIWTHLIWFDLIEYNLIWFWIFFFYRRVDEKEPLKESSFGKRYSPTFSRSSQESLHSNNTALEKFCFCDLIISFIVFLLFFFFLLLERFFFFFCFIDLLSS